jgi:hypothetical protein
MKALSGMQPWWHAIIHLNKRIENRVAESSAHRAMRRYRCPLLLHASAGIDSLGCFDSAVEQIREVIGDRSFVIFRSSLEVRFGRRKSWAPGDRMLRGGIVGKCRVAGLITPDGAPFDLEAAAAIQRLKPDMRWHIPGQWGHILEEVEELPFVACKGALGLWEFDETLLHGARKDTP